MDRPALQAQHLELDCRCCLQGPRLVMATQQPVAPQGSSGHRGAPRLTMETPMQTQPEYVQVP